MQTEAPLKNNAKEALVTEIKSALQKFKPQFLGNYSDTLQYKILLLVKQYDLKNEVCLAFSKKEWDKIWKRFESESTRPSPSEGPHQ